MTLSTFGAREEVVSALRAHVVIRGLHIFVAVDAHSFFDLLGSLEAPGLEVVQQPDFEVLVDVQVPGEENQTHDGPDRVQIPRVTLPDLWVPTFELVRC